MRPAFATLLGIVLLSFTVAIAVGQAPPRNPPPFAMGPAVRSPEVQADGCVTFRLRAPNAREVILARAGAPRAPMSKDDQGTWSVTTDPLPPDFYPYNFLVDGLSLADPANPLVKPIVMGGNQSLVHVPGPPSLSWELNDVPRGTLHRHFYRSGIIGDERDFYVYTPPGYDPNGKEKYPVLYLLHGLTDDASAWTAAGRANVILDNLIARGKAKPMLMVNTLGYGMPDPGRNLRALFDPASRQRVSDHFIASVLEEVMPQVEKAYRVGRDRDSRAIAGLSMGGAQALSIGLNHLDRFAWIGSFSGALVMLDEPARSFPGLDAGINPRVRLLWIACGTEDGLINGNRTFEEWLKSKGIRFTSIETPGAHTWMVWRRNLTEFAPLLFRARSK